MWVGVDVSVGRGVFVYYMCVYKYIHTHTHTYMHTCIHAYMHTCIHAYMHTYIRIHIYIHTHIIYPHICSGWKHYRCIYTYTHI